MITEPADVTSLDEVATPALVVDGPTFEDNLATMSSARPGRALRPHVKAFKSTPSPPGWRLPATGPRRAVLLGRTHHPATG